MYGRQAKSAWGQLPRRIFFESVPDVFLPIIPHPYGHGMREQLFIFPIIVPKLLPRLMEFWPRTLPQ